MAQGRSWSDGTSFSADDVKFTFDYIIKHAGALGAQAYFLTDYHSSEVVDGDLILTMATGNYTAMKTVCNSIPIIPLHIWQSIREPGREKNLSPVGTGNYFIAEGDYIEGSSITAMATALSPRLLIADEPTTALDVTIQTQILELLSRLCREEKMALLMITHDLGVVREIADRVYVMYCSRIVEQGTVEQVMGDPQHPYTRALLDTVPPLDRPIRRFTQIPHQVPHPSDKPPGCHFSNRCPHCTGLCQMQMPPLFQREAASPVNPPDRCRFLRRCPQRCDLCRTAPLPPPCRVGADHTARCHLLNQT